MDGATKERVGYLSADIITVSFFHGMSTAFTSVSVFISWGLSNKAQYLVSVLRTLDTALIIVDDRFYHIKCTVPSGIHILFSKTLHFAPTVFVWI